MTRYHPWILASLLLAGAAHAQSDQAQLTRPAGAAELNSHLSRLADNPRDVMSLIGAGEAALELDDPRAAAGFFARAEAVQPSNGRIKAGLGRVMLKMQNPAEALRQFDQAARLGYPDSGFLSDRALARDLTGDQAGAQRDYQAALQKAPDDPELIRRYAASLGISGQIEASDKVLQPLLYKSDRAAWRYRAFILAMNNRQADAKKIAEQTMPAQLASALTPYMQKMPYLTAAQKAAAVHFGHFPTNVGTRIAAVTPTAPPPSAAASATAAPVAATPAPSAAREGRRSRGADRGAARVAQATANPAPAASSPAPAPTPSAPMADPYRSPPSTAVAASQPPAPQTQAQQAQTQQVQTQQVQTQQVRPQQTPQPQPVPSRPMVAPAQPAPQPQPRQVQATPPSVRQAEVAPPPASPSGSVQGPPAPGFESTQVARAPAAAPAQQAHPGPSAPPARAPAATVQMAVPATQAAAAAPAPRPDPHATRTLADIIHAIDVPESEMKPSVAPVDLAEVAALQAARRAEREAAADKAKKAAAAKAKAEADAKAKKEAAEKKRLADNPARSWVQIGTGSDKGALAFTLRNLRKKYEEVAPQDGWTASWGRTNRLLIGPFPSFTRARAVESKLKGAGADAFAWQSGAGEVVERIGGK
ncbi:SPOR domain-containing protein [Sphingobium cloacae]|uniref:Sporulation protein n=1 Tax=Sphingobium cloacae TaxID=120107 RepID=A0A1E1F663_9SPHN|nr:SPOR domain-containing protein [Sphingobium cloacae]BAV65982.1 sporulation protein [Sphingobium cloacae]